MPHFGHIFITLLVAFVFLGALYQVYQNPGAANAIMGAGTSTIVGVTDALRGPSLKGGKAA